MAQSMPTEINLRYMLGSTHSKVDHCRNELPHFDPSSTTSCNHRVHPTWSSSSSHVKQNNKLHTPSWHRSFTGLRSHSSKRRDSNDSDMYEKKRTGSDASIGEVESYQNNRCSRLEVLQSKLTEVTSLATLHDHILKR